MDHANDNQFNEGKRAQKVLCFYDLLFSTAGRARASVHRVEP